MYPKPRLLKKLIRGVLFCAGLAITSSILPSARAQAGLGALAGTITDTTNAVVSNATVTLINKGTGFERTTTTSVTGAYRFFALDVGGGYLLRVSAPGFKTVELQDIATSVGTILTMDVTIEVGQASETVEVSASANVEQVQTETAAISQLVDSEIWQSSPLENRTQNAFVNLTAGATPDSGTHRGSSVDGARTGTGNFMVDGMDNNDQGQGGGGAVNGGGAVTTISPDAIQEYRVLSHNLPAEYGRAGGFATDTVLKSGTSKWHGSLFEYNRVQALAADDYFSKRAGIIDHLVRNQFGGSFGGPAYKDRTFFYATVEFHRFSHAYPVTGTTTTPDFLDYVKSGDFERFLEGTKDQNPSTTIPTIGLCPAYLGAACPGALPHAGGLGKVFQTLMAKEPTAFPVGTSQGTPVAQGLYTHGIQYPVNVYATTTRDISESLEQNRGSLKLDHRLGPNDQLSFAYLADLYTDNASNGAQGGSAFGPPGSSIGGAQNFSATWTHTLSPTLLNLFRAGYLRHVSNYSAAGTRGVPMIASANDPMHAGFGAFSGFPQLFTENEFLYSDSITKSMARHAVKAGFQYIRTRNGSSFYNDVWGTMLPWDVENMVTDAALYDDFEPLLYGGPGYGSLYMASASIDPSNNQLPDPYRGFRANEYAGYLQDDWKVTPHLTVNLGVRWDYFGPPHNFKKGFDSNVYFGNFGVPTPSGNPFQPTAWIAGALQGATFQQRDKDIWHKDTRAIGPRFGFSYDIFGNGKMALRGGYGIGFDRLYNNAYENLRFNPPHYADNAIGTLVNGVAAGSVLQPGLYNAPFTANALLEKYQGKPIPRHIDQRLRDAYYEQYNLGIEYEVKAGYVWETNYVGTLGRRLVGLDNINTYAGRTACPPGTYEQGTPCYEAGYPNGFTSQRITKLFDNDNFRTNGFTSNYNALQTSLRKGYSNGLQFMANYTYSKSLDQISDVFAQRNAATGPQNPYHWSYDYGPADFDMRHNFVLTLNYHSGWKKNNRLLGGWGVSPIITMSSGTPFTPYDSSGSYNPLKDGRPGTNRTVYKGSGSPKNAVTHASSPATAFLKPIDSGDYFGPYSCRGAELWCEPPAGRNAITGPAAKNVDLGILKHVSTWEHQGFTLQGNLFNFFNHANFANPVSDYNDGNYGKSLSDAGPRVTQLSLRYDF